MQQKNLNVRMPLELINKIDQRARSLGWTRAQIVKEYIAKGVCADKRFIVNPDGTEVGKEYVKLMGGE